MMSNIHTKHSRELTYVKKHLSEHGQRLHVDGRMWHGIKCFKRQEKRTLPEGLKNSALQKTYLYKMLKSGPSLQSM